MANNARVQKLNFQEIVIAPNLISLFRILAAVVIFIAAVAHEVNLWVAFLYLAAVLSDKLDGATARFFNKETKLGEKLEPIADSLLSYATVTYLFLNLTLPQWIFYLAVALLFWGVAISLIFYFKRGRWFIPKIKSSKAALFVLYTTGVFYFFNLPYREFLLYLAVVFGLLAYFDYLRQLIKNNQNN